MTKRQFRRLIRRGYGPLLPEPLPCPVEHAGAAPVRPGIVSRCAGIVVFLMLMGLLASSWGDPRFSPASRRIEGEWVPVRLEETREFLLLNGMKKEV